MEDFKTVFGQRLKSLRKSNNLTLKDLAKQIDVSWAAISQYENGVNGPSFEHMVKIAHFFQVSIDYMLNVDSKDFNKDSEEYGITFYLAKKNKISAKTLNDVINLISKEKAAPTDP